MCLIPVMDKKKIYKSNQDRTKNKEILGMHYMGKFTILRLTITC